MCLLCLHIVLFIITNALGETEEKSMVENYNSEKQAIY